MAVTLFPKKITTATMGLNIPMCEEVAKNSTEKETPVLRIWGTVQDRTEGVSQFGTYKVFKGQFGAINLIDAAEARSEKVILPAVAETLVNSLYEQAAKNNGIPQIALEITVRFNNSAKGGNKFAYGVKPLVEFKGDDALAVMLKQLPPVSYVKKLTNKK